jgi:hypothetical protein
MQSTYGPIVFSHVAAHGIPFTKSRRILARAARLCTAFARIYRASPDDVLFNGRIGKVSKPPASRSLRKPLEQLLEK